MGWPRTGDVQRLLDVPVDATIVVEQGKPGWQRVVRTPVRLGGAR